MVRRYKITRRKTYQRRYPYRYPVSPTGRRGIGTAYNLHTKYIAAIPRGLQLKKHHFKQTFHPINISVNPSCHYTSTGVGAVGSGVLYGPSTTDPSPAGYFSYYFTLAEIPQVTSFTSLFDAYRINKLVIKFIPLVQYTQLGNGAANLAAEPQWLSTVVDYDDSGILTTEGALLEYETFKQSSPNRKHVRTFVPATSQNLYKSSGTTIAYSQKRKPWIDAAYTDVEHYGIKGLINGPATQANQVQTAFKVYVTAYISFKQTR